MPRKVFELVRARAYDRVSSEIFVKAKVGGKQYPYALKAVALLGGETPAVQTLDDIHALYALDSTVLAYNEEAEVRAYEFASAPLPKEVIQMADKEKAPVEAEETECMKHLKTAREELQGYKKKLSETEAKVIEIEPELAKFKAENETLKAELSSAKEGLVKAEGEVAKVHSEQRRQEVRAAVAKFVEGKKVLPSQAAALEAILIQAKESQPRKFKVLEGEKETEFESTEALILGFVDKGGAGLPTEPQTEGGKSSSVADPDDGKAMDAAVKEYMVKHEGTSYRQAYIELAKASGKEANKS